MKALSTLAQSVRASTTMAIDTQFKKMRAEGIDVIGFSVGEPDFPTPEHIKQAGIRAIENDQTKYTPTPGTLALRQAVRKRLQEDWGLDYTTEEIVVSGGGKPILYVALKTLLNPGDEVILPAPNPVLTTIRYFREEYEAHIRDKKCPAHECSALLTISIDPAKCTGCTVCARKCPVECISGTRKEPHVIDQSACIKCKQCVSSCKFGAIVVD